MAFGAAVSYVFQGLGGFDEVYAIVSRSNVY